MINRRTFPDLPRPVRLVLLTLDSLLEGLAIWVAITIAAPFAGALWAGVEIRNTWENQ